MTDWKQMAEIFAVAQRHMKLSTSQAQNAASIVGSILHRLAVNDTPELREELRRAQAAFEKVR